MVLKFYNLCANLLGRSPAAQVCHLEWIRFANDNDSEGNAPQSLTYFPQTETNIESLVAGDQEEFVDVERDGEIHNKSEDKGNENVTTAKNELSKANKAVIERRQDVKNILKNRKDKEIGVKLSTESQLLPISRDDLDLKKAFIENR